MTYEEISAMAVETGLPFAYDHFAEGDCPDPPFLVFLFPRSDNYAADGRVYQKASELHFELYTDKKDPAIEEQIESVLTRQGFAYEKSETWIPDEKMYEVKRSLWAARRSSVRGV